MPEPFLTVYGHTNLDYIMSLDHFPERNTSVNVLEKKRYFGGTAANVATIAASLGVPSALASYVGPDFPDDFRQLMASKGVDLADLVSVDGYETPTVWIVSDSEHNQIAYVYQGPMGVMDDMKVRATRALSSKYVHIMTGRPNYYLRLMSVLKDRNVSVAFDPAQEIHNVWDAQLFGKALSMTGMFFGNESEVRTALRYLGRDAPEELLDFVPTVVLTKGSKGSAIMTKGETIEIPAVPPRTIVDTTGCGDAFRAGYYAGMYHGLSVRDAAVIGSAAASFIIEQRGALTNIPDWQRTFERAEQYM